MQKFDQITIYFSQKKSFDIFIQSKYSLIKFCLETEAILCWTENAYYVERKYCYNLI